MRCSPSQTASKWSQPALSDSPSSVAGGGWPAARARPRRTARAQLFAFAPARVHEQRAPEVERDGPQHEPRVPDGMRPPRRAAPWRRGRGRPSRPQDACVSRGARQSPAGAPSRLAHDGGGGRSTSVRLRSMLPHAGHISGRVSCGAPSGARKLWRHSPHSYSCCQASWYSLQEATRVFIPIPYRFVSRVKPGTPVGGAVDCAHGGRIQESRRRGDHRQPGDRGHQVHRRRPSPAARR